MNKRDIIFWAWIAFTLVGYFWVMRSWESWHVIFTLISIVIFQLMVPFYMWKSGRRSTRISEVQIVAGKPQEKTGE